MKSNKFFFLLLLILLQGIQCTISYAQEEEEKPQRWEVGIDLLPLVDKGSFPIHSLFGRYDLSPDKTKKTFLRLRAGYEVVSYLDTSTLGITYDHDRLNFGYLILAGLQKDVLRSEKTSVYIGGDLSYRYWKLDYKWDTFTLKGYEYYGEKFLGLHGLAGFNYRLNDYIHLSVESSISLIHRNYFLKEEVWFFDSDGNDLGGRIRDNSSNRISSQINPFHQIVLTYQF